ncbi:hypothetical protein E2C01_064759 [Portunus trituberculatus]|uniref:Reverse transcriptase domain-containing protein n=1 Tax=Portunus trituberculatus TaxID=210409 RepID=A0A5B7HL79_PORTR|nr:hypothetical protein [Portunus trituberculatus]
MLEEFVDEIELENLNVALAEGRVTRNAREHESAIDYMLVNERMREIVLHVWIDEDGMVDIVSDHSMLVMECLMQSGSEVRVVEKNEIKEAIRQFWEEVDGVGEVLGVRDGCVTLQRKNADELNERISKEEVERCVKRQKNGKAAGPVGIPYEMYKNSGEVVIGRLTEVFNQFRRLRLRKRMRNVRLHAKHYHHCYAFSTKRWVFDKEAVIIPGKIRYPQLVEAKRQWHIRFEGS